jgi:hypothetical protein
MIPPDDEELPCIAPWLVPVDELLGGVWALATDRQPAARLPSVIAISVDLLKDMIISDYVVPQTTATAVKPRVRARRGTAGILASQSVTSVRLRATGA